MAGHHPPRSAVVDLGSNSVRLVVFEGLGRNPVAIFNEKAVLRLGRGLQTTGRLNEDGVAAALTVMHRYHAIATAMRADPFEVLATAAVRDASNGPEFVAGLRQRMPGVPIRILSGEAEASLSAAGMLCGIPRAEGVLADIGGGSLEVVQLGDGRAGPARTLPLGVIRLADRAEGDLLRARALAEADLAAVPWLGAAPGRNLYLVGGAWRALARIHIMQTGYKLRIVHHYTIGRDEVRDLTAMIAAAPRRVLEKLPGAPRRRLDDLPLAAIVLRRVLRATGARRVVFSANGIREGWFMQRVPAVVAAMDPVLAASQEMGNARGRDPAFPPALIGWTAALAAAAAIPETARSAPAARGGVLAVGCRQPRPPGLPRGTILLAGAAAAGCGAGPFQPRLPGARGGGPLRGGPGFGLPRHRADPARPGGDPAGRAAGLCAAPGLHAVCRGPRTAGRDGAAGDWRAAAAAAGRRRRRVLGRERHAAAGPSGAGAGAAGGD